MGIKGKRPTGEIIPRTYGVMLSMPGRDNLFVSPMPYALAQIQLERTNEIRTRLKRWASSQGRPFQEVEDQFTEGVGGEHERDLLLNHTRRPEQFAIKPAIKGVRHYGPVFTGEVISRTYDSAADEKEYHAVSLRHPPTRRDINVGFPRGECDCGDSKWNGYKRKEVTSVCAHLAALEIALATDAGGRTSAEDNMTGLSPKQRAMTLRGGDAIPHPHLPFTFNSFKPVSKMNAPELKRHDALTRMIMGYFTEGKRFYELNTEALSRPEVFSPELLNAIKGLEDRARFVVLRQDERSIRSESESQDRLYGATTHALEQIDSFLGTKNFVPVGYTREFVGTPWETVARRYVESGSRGATLVYSVCTKEGLPPVIVRRNLDHKSGNLLDSSDPMPEVHPFARINRQYASRDDTTRRNSQTQVVLPTAQRSITIAANLAEHYKSIQKRHPSSQSSSLLSSTM